MKTLNAAAIATENPVAIQKVLVAVDLSSRSVATATYAAELAKCFNASLTLVYVYEPIPVYVYASEYTYALNQDKREDLQKVLDQLTQKARRLGGVVTRLSSSEALRNRSRS